MSKKLTDEQVQEIIRLHGEGFNNKEVARLLSINDTTVGRTLNRLGITNTYHITDAEIENIINLHESNKILREIVEISGRGQDTVRKILHNHGLTPHGSNIKLTIRNGNGVCKTCLEEKPLSNFLHIPKKNTYRGSCNECCNKNRVLHRNKNLTNYFRDRVSGLKARAKKESLDFNIDSDFLFEIYQSQRYACFYTGQLMGTHSNVLPKRESRLSVDKVVPHKGYVKGNVVLCCNWINVMKQDASLETLKIWMPLVYEKIQQGYKDGILY